MMTYDHVLSGCTPVPLAGYLKALGVLRLVAEQADENARGFWLDERFVLRTILTRDELIQFFAEKYKPSPIISPWNGRAGFLEGEDEDSGEESSREGAALVRCYETAENRFCKLRDAVKIYGSVNFIKTLDKARAEAKPLQEKKRKKVSLSEGERNRLKELEALIKQYRASVITRLRSEAPDSAIEWFDACQRIVEERTVFPLLGSGGLDGSRDFGVNFGSALQTLFDLRSGIPLENTTWLIQESLGFGVVPFLGPGNLGQYDPAGVGENTTTGFIGEQPFNPMDLVLLLEGAVLFAGATARRLATNDAGLSFPFTVSALTAGSGATAGADDKNSAEFWAPIWTRPAGLTEITAIFTEGRTTVGEKDAKDGLEFVVAVRTLGSQRGIPEYQRFALLQREPRNPRKATPLGRVRVRENPRASLISELDAGGWLSRARDVTRYAIKNGKIDRSKEAPPSLRLVGRNLDEALFRLAADGSAEALQEALIGLGALMRSEAQRPNLRTTLPPPPRLSEEWAAGADDGSHEFALAAALASIDANAEKFRLPFRRHLAPLDWDEKERWWVWGKGTEAQALAVWFGRHLVRDMASVLERRLIEAQRHSFANQEQSELPLRGWRAAPLASIAAFVAGNTDDSRIAALASGLAWAKARRGAPQSAVREDALPFAYRALKPLFAPNGVGPAGEKRLLDPLPLVRLIRAGRIDDAVGRAQAMARGTGLPAPFARQNPASMVDPERLAAALLFPVAPEAYQPLIERAYPNLSKDKENEIHAA
jgi:CRISPR-associated protein Csx17